MNTYAFADLLTLASLMIIRSRARVVLLGAMLLSVPASVRAQDETASSNIDSLTAVLDSPDIEARTLAVTVLGRQDPARLPAATRVRLIALLERTAWQPAAQREPDGEDTVEGDYQIALVRVVLRLQDPAATRALALGGIAVNAASQRFVASQGDAALPFLIEAEQIDSSNQSSVTITRAYLLGDSGGRLSSQGRVSVMAAILNRAVADPTTFADAAQLSGMAIAVPLVQEMTANEPSGLAKALLVDARDSLVSMRSHTPVTGILSNLGIGIEALCIEARGARLGTCQAMRNELAATEAHLAGGRAAAARKTLDALSTRADNAVRQGALQGWEGLLVSGTATYLKTRI